METGSRAPTVWDGSPATNFTPASLLQDVFLNASTAAAGTTSPWDRGPLDDPVRGGEQEGSLQVRAYRDFTTAIQVFILVGSLIGNATMLWCAWRTSVFKSVTGRFIANLACSSAGAALVCVPFDVALAATAGPDLCCGWLRVPAVCKTIKFLHRLFCSVTMLSFAAIALDRYYSVLYPLERKISEARSRDLVIYMWAHATVASVPVFAATNVTDVYATATCSDAPARSLGHVLYVAFYNATTVVPPLALVFLLMLLVRRALSASQKKKVVIAALRTPQSGISIPYVSQREAELHAALLAAVLAFSACSAPYGALAVYRAVLGGETLLPAPLYLTAVWLPKVSLVTSPLLFLTVSRAARHSLLDLLARAHRRYSRRNVVGSGGLVSLGGESRGGAGAAAAGGSRAGLETVGRSGSQLLEMFNIGQQQIYRPSEEEEEEEHGELAAKNKIPSSLGSGVCSESPEGHSRGAQPGSLRRDGVPKKEQQRLGMGDGEAPPLTSAPRASPAQACTAYASSSQVAPATPTDSEDVVQFGFGPFELPPQWLPETRNSKKRLLPPLGNTPEELIQTKQPRPRPERRISRNNKVSTIPTVDP
ncbi:putative G-protein coupled receptor 176 [Merluccius polli]|uniref:G-protein coupled receptor 176 n=1 Tax=Merluccius polli TaxID=89951 RepID=A0AA47P537_MERPO|nr:putative G-protein coupled receptor 176 [Merluccius polli]